MAEEKTNLIQRTKDYFADLKQEMHRVTWPNRKQVEGTTLVVIFSVFAFAGYFAIVDGVLSRAVNGLFTYFGK
jgi:preprotein translocase subunit SecE